LRLSNITTGGLFGGKMMINIDIDIEAMDHRQLVDELFRHCKQRATGTVFFNLLDGQSARLVLNKGVIHWVAFEHLRGREAIESMRHIDQARFSFNPHLRMAIGEQQLPSTTYILKRLYKHRKKPATITALSIEKGVVSTSEHPEDLSEEPYFEQDQVRSILEKEALEYLGPMACVLCSEYLKPMPARLSLSQVRQLISMLKQDIKDERKGALFKTKVKRILNIL
jgi:hypothetical protein